MNQWGLAPRLRAVTSGVILGSEEEVTFGPIAGSRPMR